MAFDATAFSQALAQTLMPMMTQMQTDNARNMSELINTVAEKLVMDGSRRNKLIDCKTLGRPRDFSGKQVEWREWSAKTASYFKAADGDAGVWMPWAEDLNETITDDVILAAASRSGHDGNKAVKFSNEVYHLLLDVCKDEAYNEVDNANGNGFEAWRLLCKRYSPRTPGTKRALILAIMNMKAAKSVAELEKNIHHMEHLVRRYDAISKTPLDEAVKTAVLVNLCPSEYKDFSDLTTQDYDYREMKLAIDNWMERKRDRDPAALRRLEQVQGAGGQMTQPMDVDYLRQSQGWNPLWWQSHWDLDHVHNTFYAATEGTGEPEGDLDAFQLGKGRNQWASYTQRDKGGKGKNGGKGKGFGKDFGYKGFGKDFGYKGKGGKGGAKGGKGGKGGFYGECYHCGEWGHSQRWCEKKFAEENQGKGPAYVVEEQVQENMNDQGKLEALEERSRTSGSWRYTNHVLGNVETSNRFSPLASCDSDDEEEELNYLSSAAHPLEITVDSGASENVMGPSVAPSIPVSASLGSRAGVEYLAANGTTMRNQGEKVVPVVTQDGFQCDLKMQITDVKRPLMSVARICDAGHKVTFDSKGGVIESINGSVKVPFSRVNNVYRLCVQVDDREHFRRQG